MYITYTEQDACVNASITYDEVTNEFTGWILMKGQHITHHHAYTHVVWFVGSLTGRNGRGVYVYFVANFSEQLASHGTWNDGHVNLKSVTTTGRQCGAFAGKVCEYKISLIFNTLYRVWCISFFCCHDNIT